MRAISPTTPPTTPPPTAPPTAYLARFLGRFLARGWRLAPTAVLAVAAAGLLAACASASTQSAASAARGTATSTSRMPNAMMSAASSGTAASSGAPGLAACKPASLRVTVNVSQAGGAAGSTYYPVDFTNTSSSACGMYGYPGMSFVTTASTAGRQIGAAAKQNPSFGKRAVRLAAGGAAHAWLQVTEAGNYPASSCHPVTAHGLRVFAPGETVALYVNHSFAACSSANAPLLMVMPVRGGQGVQGSTP
jgi:hypothetical protein